MYDAQPQLSYYQSPSLPGIELLEASGISAWSWYLTRSLWIAPVSWEGEVLCHQRTHRLVPGAMFCADPDDVCCSVRVRRAGRLSALFLDVAALSADPITAPVAGGCTEPVRAGVGGARLGPRDRFAAFCQALRSGAAAEPLRASLSALLDDLGGSVPGLLRAERPARQPSALAERLRELMDADLSREQSLEHISLRLGITRFQALRAFKQNFGVSPSVYQMCLRIAGAQRALGAGATPAKVAAQFGFSDQSHLGRHFKRVVGLSPGRYARAALQRSAGHADGSS